MDNTNKPANGSGNQQGGNNHKKIAGHLEEAAKHHHEAAKHHDAGNHDKAARSTLMAQGHQTHANEALKEQVKNTAWNNETTM